jgi:hypothetical protein
MTPKRQQFEICDKTADSLNAAVMTHVGSRLSARRVLPNMHVKLARAGTPNETGQVDGYVSPSLEPARCGFKKAAAAVSRPPEFIRGPVACRITRRARIGPSRR